MLISQVNELHHQLVGSFIASGDVVVDCTVGNGHDALFLARCLGAGGHLFGFDIQEEAVERTRVRLLEGGIGEERFTLIRSSHAGIADHVPCGVGAAVYNLGYLPGGDHALVTERDSTVLSVERTLRLLRREGVAAITLYYGHEGGRHEAEGVLEFAGKLGQEEYKVLHLHYLNLPNAPPSIVLIQRAR